MMPLINTFDPSVAVNTGTDIITINAHGFIDRQGVIYHSGGGTAVGALVDGYKYYVIFVSPNTFKLALSVDNASNNVAIDLLSVGSGSIHTVETSNIYPNSAAYYDFFRKVRLLGNGASPTGNNLEADSVRDDLTIVAGSNVVFENISEEQDTFTISAAEYDFDVPVGTTELRLYGRVGAVLTDDQSIRFTVDRGINITRISDTELRFEGLGVTETDTLHSVTERGAITSNTVYLNNLEVGVIQSIPGEDGVTTVNPTGTTGTPINLTGDGTLDSPVEIDLPSSSEASKTVFVNFTTPVSGTMTYSASYKSESALTTGSVILQREDPLSPGTYVTIDSATGTTSRTAFTIQNIYAEPNPSATNFRIVIAWTGLSTGYVDFPIVVQFEIDPIYVNEILRTDTSAGELYLGRVGGNVFIQGNVSVLDSIRTDGLVIYQNNIQGVNSNGDIVVDPSGTGSVELRTQTLNTDQTTFNLLDTVATTVNAFGAATAINIGANTGTLTIENPTVVGTVAVQDLYNTNASTVNAFGDASTLNIGDTTGTITLRNPTLVGTETTQNLYNTVATTLNLAGAATTIEIGASTGTTNVNNNLVVDLDLQIKGGDLTTDQTTFNLLNTTATTINAFGAATTINVGSIVITGNTLDTNDSSGITFVPAVTFDSNIQANDVTVNQDLAVQGNITANQNLIVQGDLTVNGSTVTLNTSTLDVEDTNITIAKGAVSAAVANGAGISVDGANATLLYASVDDSWNFNKLLKAVSLENTPIGTTTRAAGNFTVFNANGSITLGDADTDTITVNSSFVTGTQIKSSKINSDTLSIAAYDVDSVTYSNLITLTASNNPTLSLTSIGVGTIDNLSIGATSPSTGKFTTLEVRDTTTPTFDLFFGSNSSVALTADRTLTFDVENASRTIALGGNIDLANNFTTNGNFAITLTTTGLTGVTLPTTGTLATLAGSESLTNKKLGSLTTNGMVTTSGSDGTLSVTATTGSGSVVLSASPTITTPNLTYTGGFGGGSGDFTVNAALTQLFYWEGSFDGTRTLSITNLTVGRLVMICVRNTNASSRQINVQASISTTGFAPVNMSKGDAGGTSVTSVTLAAVSGQAMITVFNPAGVSQNIVGKIG